MDGMSGHYYPGPRRHAVVSLNAIPEECLVVSDYMISCWMRHSCGCNFWFCLSWHFLLPFSWTMKCFGGETLPGVASLPEWGFNLSFCCGRLGRRMDGMSGHYYPGPHRHAVVSLNAIPEECLVVSDYMISCWMRHSCGCNFWFSSRQFLLHFSWMIKGFSNLLQFGDCKTPVLIMRQSGPPLSPSK